MPTPIALLELTGLGLSLGGRRILDGIDLAVAEGEQHALLAPNGAGKSSLAYALMGCSGYRPGAGQIGFRGEDIGRLPIHERARMVYSERQYHGLSGGIEVLPKTRGKVGEGACFRADFSLTQGRVGLLDIDFEVEVAAEATAELTSKVFGHVTDEIRITERVYLNGRNARGLVKSRVAVEEEARTRLVGATYGNAAGARGHVDCLEIVRGRAVAVAVPEVQVSHPEAKVIREAAIGSVDQRQLDALTARGLDPDAAVDCIILGILD